MTEQERPRTEAGRRLYRDTREGMTILQDAMRSRILAIEAEGGQQAVRVDVPPETAGVRLCTTHHACACHSRLAEIGRRYLDRMAGLNASESPHEPGCILDDRAHDVPCVTGDASESPPTRPATSPTQPGNTYWPDTPMVRDASVSGQPPEASDE